MYHAAATNAANKTETWVYENLVGKKADMNMTRFEADAVLIKLLR